MCVNSTELDLERGTENAGGMTHVQKEFVIIYLEWHRGMEIKNT